MNIRNNKGFTGVDVSVSVIVLLIFVALITSVFYNFSVKTKNVDRNSEATYIAVQVIEAVKARNFADVAIGNYNSVAGVDIPTGYTVDIKVEDYHDINQDAEEGLMKIVKVTVSYTVGNEEKSVDISTLLTAKGE